MMSKVFFNKEPVDCRLKQIGTTFSGYRARIRDPDCGNAVNPDCCGQVHLEECELPICRK